jgi:hypothetical protein
MSSSRSSTEMIHMCSLLTYLSIHFVLVDAPLFFRRFVCVISDVLSVVRIVPKLFSALQGQQRMPKGVDVKVGRLINAN